MYFSIEHEIKMELNSLEYENRSSWKIFVYLFFIQTMEVEKRRE